MQMDTNLKQFEMRKKTYRLMPIIIFMPCLVESDPVVMEKLICEKFRDRWTDDGQPAIRKAT